MAGHKVRYAFFPVLTALLLTMMSLPSTAIGDSSRPDPSPVVPLAFAAAIAPLSKAELPAYLPSWLPSLPSQLHAFASTVTIPDQNAKFGYTATYEADLSLSPDVSCSTCDLVSIKGSMKSFPHMANTRRIWIIPGIPAYVTQYTDGQWISFRIDVTHYAVRCLLPDTRTQTLHPCSIGQYLHIIRSLVWVN